MIVRSDLEIAGLARDGDEDIESILRRTRSQDRAVPDGRTICIGDDRGLVELVAKALRF